MSSAFKINFKRGFKLFVSQRTILRLEGNCDLIVSIVSTFFVILQK